MTTCWTHNVNDNTQKHFTQTKLHSQHSSLPVFFFLLPPPLYYLYPPLCSTTTTTTAAVNDQPLPPSRCLSDSDIQFCSYNSKPLRHHTSIAGVTPPVVLSAQMATKRDHLLPSFRCEYVYRFRMGHRKRKPENLQPEGTQHRPMDRCGSPNRRLPLHPHR